MLRSTLVNARTQSLIAKELKLTDYVISNGKAIGKIFRGQKTLFLEIVICIWGYIVCYYTHNSDIF